MILTMVTITVPLWLLIVLGVALVAVVVYFIILIRGVRTVGKAAGEFGKAYLEFWLWRR